MWMPKADRCRREAGAMGQSCTQPLEGMADGVASISQSRTQQPPSASASGGKWTGQYAPELVNAMLQAAWPSVEQFSIAILQKTVIPGFRAALITHLGSKGEQFEIDFDSYSIGQVPVRFGEMKLSEGHQVGDDGELNVVNCRTQVEWDGDVHIFASFMGLSGGLTKVRLRGDMLIEMVGTSPIPPLFQGARGCFIHPPEIKIEYDAGWMKLAKVAPIDAIVHKVIEEQLTNKLVVPNRMGVRFDPSCEMFRIIKPRPAGLLKITFHSASGLLAADVVLFRKASSDPWIKIRCGAMLFNSPVVQNTLNPQFEWEALIPIDLPRDQLIDIEVWDKDYLNSSDFLGAVNGFKIMTMITEQGKMVEHELMDQDGKANKRGKLKWTSEWRPLKMVHAGTDTMELLQSDTVLVFAGVYRAQHLPDCEPNTKYWVEVQCSDRLGLYGSDVTQPHRSTKKAVDHLVVDESATVTEKKLFAKKKAICQKYSISKEETAILFGVDPNFLDETLADGMDAFGCKEVLWNFGTLFFVSKPRQATLTIKLMTNGVDTSERALMTRAASAFSTQVRGREVESWTVGIADLIISDADPKRSFEAKDGLTVLHTRLQVRCLGAAMNDVHDPG